MDRLAAIGIPPEEVCQGVNTNSNAEGRMQNAEGAQEAPSVQDPSSREGPNSKHQGRKVHSRLAAFTNLDLLGFTLMHRIQGLAGIPAQFDLGTLYLLTGERDK